MYSTYFADKYPQRIEHLILISPAGVNSSGLKQEDLPLFLKVTSRFYITPMVRNTSPFVILYASGFTDCITRAYHVYRVLFGSLVH